VIIEIHASIITASILYTTVAIDNSGRKQEEIRYSIVFIEYLIVFFVVAIYLL